MITPEQEPTIRQFTDTWNLSMPYHDIGTILNRGECNALLGLWYAFEEFEAGRALLESQVVMRKMMIQTTFACRLGAVQFDSGN